ncbi:M28 family peptidase [Flavilitoribacter nigricans]|uniref:M28 family peptidase n=1 Tax=Flavilitoribacter nigricans TaxID=70997 RepID=UPI001F2FAFC1|nr:M28 family peptidase [Flavilitoribacter nigricans]
MHFTLCLFLILPLLADAQSNQKDEDAFYIRSIFDHALTSSNAYDWLYDLCKGIGARLSGSPQAAAAVNYTRQIMDTLQLDSVWLQPCEVPHWERGKQEIVRVVNSSQIGSLPLKGVALGNSIGTPAGGITAEVVEVKTLDEVDALGEAGVAGKIVFFNRPLDPTHINTFRAYGGAVDQRGSGASRAARYGAVGVLVRSMTTSLDDVPHTGSLRYDPDYPAIPAIAITTKDANLLSQLLENESVRVYMYSDSRMLSNKISYNVIGEIKGSEFPDEIIVVGGHLDSWDLGEGAHDDGTGCVQSMAVLQTLRQLGYQPKRTIRCVLFMNEENGLVGGRTYWQASDDKNEYHMAAIESDRGGFTPRGFTAEGRDDVFKKKFKKATRWLPLLEPYGLTLSPGGSGADISGLKSQGGLLFGLYPDSQRYFDYHHTDADRFETVNKREMELGAGAMTALVYLLDKYGLD